MLVSAINSYETKMALVRKHKILEMIKFGICPECGGNLYFLENAKKSVYCTNSQCKYYSEKNLIIDDFPWVKNFL